MQYDRFIVIKYLKYITIFKYHFIIDKYIYLFGYNTHLY